MATDNNDERELSWSEVASGAQKTAGHSTAQAALSVVQPFLHPIQTATTFKELGKGLYSKALSLSGVPGDSADKEKDEAVVNAIGQYYADRYGSIKGLKKALASDPASVVADVAGVLSLGTGTAVRAPGLIGKAARAVNKAAMVADPTNLAAQAFVRAPTKALQVISSVKGPALSGVSSRSIKEARLAGLNKTNAYNLARTGKLSGNDIVDLADQGLDKLRAARNQQYRTNSAFIRANTTPLSYSDIEDQIRKLRTDNLSRQGIPVNPAVDKTLSKIEKEVQAWKKSGHNTAGDFDDLKKRLSQLNFGKLSAQKPNWDGAVVGKVLGSIRSTINKQVPEYSRFMGDYAEASDIIDDMRRSLALGQHQNYASGISRLQIAFKGGKGRGAFNDLAEIAPELPAAVAGYNMQEWLPKGLSQYIAPFALAGNTAAVTAGLNPLTVASTALHASPRALGRVTYGGGAASRMATKWSPEMRAAVIGARETEDANTNRPISAEEAEQALLMPGMDSRLGPMEQDAGGHQESLSPEQVEQMFNNNMKSDVDDLLQRTMRKESAGSGDYSAVGKDTGHGRAYGAYQIMDSNIPVWTQEVLGQSMTPEEFLNNPEAQDKVARAKMEQMYAKYGNPQDVSSVWHSGVPLEQARKEGRHDVNMLTTDYVADVTHGMGESHSSDEERAARATGGSVKLNHAAEAAKLIAAADRAKRIHNQSTERLLALPDEHVTRALAVANESI